MQPDATPTHDTADQDARLAYEAYRDALGTSFRPDWKQLTLRMQQAWRGVAEALRTTRKEDTP